MLKAKHFHNLKFKRQYPVGDYIVDFIYKKKKLIIEIDGGQHNQPIDIEHDKIRTMFLNSKGYRAVRFWNNEIYENIDGVFKKLEEFI